MQLRAYIFSGILHSLVIAFLLWDFSFSMTDYEKSSVPVIMIDLQKVQIGELTNLPQKVKKQTPKKTKAETKSTPKKQKQKTTVKKTTPKPTPKPEPVKPKEQPKPKDSVKAVEPPKKEKKTVKKEVKKETPKSQPKQIPQSEKTKNKNKNADRLKSLLASVEDIKKNARPSTQEQDIPNTGQEVQDGIDGGTEGSLMQPLTISEKDLIANKLRSCWNVDAGLKGIENMIVEVRAYVNRDGSIRDVKILNMRSDTAFRSVAESARRAIYICENKDDSPFKMLADKRGDNYQQWKEIFVRFNPLDGGVY